MDNNDYILDPFSESYTTGMAAYKKGVGSVCIEISDEYYKLGQKRFREHENNIRQE